MRILPEMFPLQLTAIICVAMIVPGDPAAYAQMEASQAPAPAQEATFSAQALDSLVAPIALFPDPLVAQVLAASTYPMQVVEAQQWLSKNSSLQGQALVQAAAKQNWDPSVQALVLFPSVLDQMSRNVEWTTALGNAFLAQEQDVLAAVQSQRQRAYSAGVLKSNAQQNVEMQQVAGSQAIVIQPANPDVMYVPYYNPTAVFGPAPAYYPYPAYYPPTGAVVGAGVISFGAGLALGAVLGGWHGGWGWGPSWGPHPTVYVNNNFISGKGFRPGYPGRPGAAPWAHNPSFRRGVPYSNPSVARRYGGAYRPPAGPTGLRPPTAAPGAITGPQRPAAGALPGANRLAPGVTPPLARPQGSPAGAITGPGRGPSNMRPATPPAAGVVPAPNRMPVRPPAGPQPTPRGSAARSAPVPQAAPRAMPAAPQAAPRAMPSAPHAAPRAMPGAGGIRGGANRMGGHPSMGAPRGGGRRR